MGWMILMTILCLSASHSTRADCVSKCLACSQHIMGSNDPQINPLVCSLQCEGSLLPTTEWERCGKLQLEPLKQDSKRKQECVAGSEPNVAIIKRYGGFMKKLDKSKFLFSSPQRENNLKGEAYKKYGGFPRKYGERELMETTTDPEQDVENPITIERGVQGWGAKNDRKRYGGFLRKYPKRSQEGALGVEQEETDPQKRYGGFMRRIRPKLKWDNQKRYGGFLRRQFKISARSEEEPTASLGKISDL